MAHPFTSSTRKGIGVVAAATAAAAASTAVLLAGGANASVAHHERQPVRTAPAFDPSNFGDAQGNPYFPLRAGLVTRLRGSEDGVHYREKVTVTHRHKRVDGVRARVVHDVLRRANGSLAERTDDWYAADDDGNVWYLGEQTATYDRHGDVQSREGSWQAGKHGAVPGLIMPRNPHATDAYRQEYFRGHAEDQGWLVGFKRSVKTPARRFHHVLRSFEWTRLEPDVMSQKFYAWGVGIISERDISGGNEKFSLVSVHRP